MPDSQEFDLQHARHQPSLTPSYPLDDSEEVERFLAGTASLSKKPVFARTPEKDDGADAGERKRSDGGREDALRLSPLSTRPSPPCARPAPRGPGSSPARRRAGPAAAGQAARRRGAAAVGLSRPTNPFVEYEDREIKLQQERKWLEQDSVFMRIRREGMRHQGATQRHATRSASESSLYENRTMFGNYSVQMRKSRASRGGGGSAACAASRAPQVASGNRPTGKHKENHPTLNVLKQLQQAMEESMKDHEDCMKRSGFCDDSFLAKPRAPSSGCDASGSARPASAQACSTPLPRARSDGMTVRRASCTSVRSAAAH